MVLADKQDKLNRLDEAYDKMEECFRPLTEAGNTLREIGYQDQGDVVMASVSTIQRIEAFVLAERRRIKEGS